MTRPTNTFIHFLKEKILKHGYISFAEFMEDALYHPIWGYYNTDSFHLGKQGDFITAPEISPLFAQCIANQALEVFAATGTPNILELGAGTGKLAHDILFYLDKINQPPSNYYIYEKSWQLRKKQQVFLAQHCPHLYSRISWLDELPPKFSGIIIANEVLDAIPVHRFLIENQAIKERCVSWEADSFIWKTVEPDTQEFMITLTPIHESQAFYSGYESEINLQLKPFLTALTKSLHEGVILLIDYGYGQREYYHPDRNQGTLTCFYQHHFHHNPLILPGQQDITAHVDFTRVADIAIEDDCDLLGYTTQAAFLLASGMRELATEAESTLSPLERVKYHQAIKLLTFPTEMGERIKVMALGKNTPRLSGFNLLDKRREL